MIVILLLCSLGLVALALALFFYSAQQGDCDRSETLCLLPLEDDAPPRAVDGADPESPPEVRAEEPVSRDVSGE